MAMNIANLLDKTFQISFVYEDATTGKKEKIEAEILEAVATPSFGQAVVDLESRKDFEGIARELARVIKGWNIDYNGTPYPPSFENLRVCPIEFLSSFVQAVMETWQGKAETSKASRSGSGRTAK